MPKRWVWLGIATAATAYEIWALKQANESTLSATLRRLFHTETKPGQAAFTISLAAIGCWLWRHITHTEPTTHELETATTQ